jgi:hypothetical protein
MFNKSICGTDLSAGPLHIRTISNFLDYILVELQLSLSMDALKKCQSTSRFHDLCTFYVKFTSRCEAPYKSLPSKWKVQIYDIFLCGNFNIHCTKIYITPISIIDKKGSHKNVNMCARYEQTETWSLCSFISGPIANARTKRGTRAAYFGIHHAVNEWNARDHFDFVPAPACFCVCAVIFITARKSRRKILYTHSSRQDHKELWAAASSRARSPSLSFAYIDQ